jgi:hypothetical protein
MLDGPVPRRKVVEQRKQQILRIIELPAAQFAGESLDVHGA